MSLPLSKLIEMHEAAVLSSAESGRGQLSHIASPPSQMHSAVPLCGVQRMPRPLVPAPPLQSGVTEVDRSVAYVDIWERVCRAVCGAVEVVGDNDVSLMGDGGEGEARLTCWRSASSTPR